MHLCKRISSRPGPVWLFLHHPRLAAPPRPAKQAMDLAQRAQPTLSSLHALHGDSNLGAKRDNHHGFHVVNGMTSFTGRCTKGMKKIV